MSSLFVYCPRLVVPLVTLVMGLGLVRPVRPMSDQAGYLACFRRICVNSSASVPICYK